MSAETSFNDRTSTSIDVLKKLGAAGKGAALWCVSCGEKARGTIIGAAAATAKFAATGLAFRRTDKPWYHVIYDTKSLKNILGLISSALKCSIAFIPTLDRWSIALTYLSQAILECDIIEMWPTFKELVEERKFVDIFAATIVGALSSATALRIEATLGTGIHCEALAMLIAVHGINYFKNKLIEPRAQDLSDLVIDTKLEFGQRLRICERLGLGQSGPQSQGEKLFLQCLGMFMTTDGLLGAWQSFFSKKSSDTPVGHKAETMKTEPSKSTAKRKKRKKKKSQIPQNSSQQEQSARAQETSTRAKTQKP